MTRPGDGAALENLAALTRADFLKWTAGTAVAAAGSGAILAGSAGASRAGPSPKQDGEILTYLLSLERLEVAWPRGAANLDLDPELSAYASTVAHQDGEHLELLARLVGDTRSTLPDVSDALPSARRFGANSVSLKEAVAAAYIGQSGNLTRSAVLDVLP